jgi:UDP-GlcNAc:undecaprenyl-phosphate GlcNAc-1-phosphate transferase
VVQRLALAAGAIDAPGDARRIHKAATPLWGGIAIYAGFVAVLLVSLPHDHYVWSMLAGATLLLAVGLWDDRFGIRPGIKLLWQLLAAVILIANGVGIDFITSPFGGVLHLDNPAIAVPINHVTHHFRLLSDGFTIFWVVGMVNTINFLDGLDGLAAGVSGISAVIIAALSVGLAVDQPQTATLALGLAGAAAGFLPRNFYPAKIFMGDSGSMFLGFVLGVLAILSGSKVATAVLVLGFPILDVAWAIVRRRRRGVSPFTADREHLHHLLLEVGFSQRTAVLTMYSLTGLFGLLALSADRGNKLLLMGILLAVMVALLAGLALRIRKQAARAAR